MAAVKAETNLEKRSEKALIYAGELLTSIRSELDTAHVEKIQSQLREFEAAVELSLASLYATGKNARRSPKPFKRAEARLRELSRRLETLKRDMSVDDRDVLDSVSANLNKKIDSLVEATLRGS
jgi:RNA polymerase-interacting CarD/CdnL/TRCF family regulator